MTGLYVSAGIPFTHVPSVITQVHNHPIPCSASFDFCSFLADPAAVRDWNIQVSGGGTRAATARQHRPDQNRRLVAAASRLPCFSRSCCFGLL